MPSSTSDPVLPPNVMNELSELFQQLCIPQRRRKALDEFLSDEELQLVVQRNDPNLPGLEHTISSKRIVDVLADQRNWSHARAVIELAYGLDMLGPGRFRRLRSAIGEPIEG